MSLSFDDAWSSQTTAAQMLSAHNMKGTFFVNSDTVGTPGHLSWADVNQLAANGNEIGGHTLDHVDLLAVDYTEVQRQVCDDRAHLLNRGFKVKDFAYPYGDGYTDATIKSIIQGCGYNSARRAWGLHTDACPTCSYTERAPPLDAYATRTEPSIQYDTTLQTIESYVTGAETHGGGWLQLTFHQICDNACDQYSITPAALQAFLDWLAPRAQQGTVVKTVTQVVGGVLQPSPPIGDTTPPSTTISCNGGPCTSAWYGGPMQVAMAATDDSSGVEAIRYTTDGTTPTLSSPVYTGPLTIASTTVFKYRAWDNAGNSEATKTQLVSVDSAPPASSIACNGSACAAGWYAAPVQVSLTASDAASGVGAIRYTTDGSDPTSSSTLYTGPFTVSQTTTVKYRAWDNVGNAEATNAQLLQVDTSPPAAVSSCNGAACSSGWYTGPVQVALSATDDASGVAAIRYTTDGSDPTSSSTLYTGPFTVSQTTVVKFRAWDTAGNAAATASQPVQVDVTAPASSISCNGGACSSSSYGGAVAVSLGATDSGSGVSTIRYTTDGSDPTQASPVYTGPFTVSQTTTVEFRAWDNAGNVEGIETQTITIVPPPPDTTPPASTIACNGGACSSGWYTGPVQVALSATDDASGVAAIRYTTDGSDPTSSSTVYTGPFTVSQTATVKYRAWDYAGNSESVNTQQLQIDVAAPSSSIACNGATCSGTWSRSAVQVSLSAKDDNSGVAAIRYTTDGTDPTSSSSSYTGSFTVSQTTTIKYRAWDNAGNAEPTESAIVQVDGTAPTVAITAPTAGSNVTGTVRVSASAADSDSGISKVVFYVDGNARATVTAAPYRFNWNTANFTTGTHTLTAIATDVAGNRTQSAPVTVTSS